jgi:ribosomal protein L23
MDSNVLRKPIFSEKGRDKAALGIYTFEVERSASKRDIKKALEAQFGARAKKIRTRTQKPKTRRAGKRRYEVQTKSFKIAEVTLVADQKIDLWEVSKEEKLKGKEKKKEKEKEPARQSPDGLRRLVGGEEKKEK